MKKLILLLVLIIGAAASIFCSCSGSDYPDEMEFDNDVYSISFSGDVDDFFASYSLRCITDNSTLFDCDNNPVTYFSTRDLSEPKEIKFRYQVDGSNHYVQFSCTALCKNDIEQKVLTGVVKRIHNYQTIDIATFEIQSFKSDEKPDKNKYSYSVNI